MSVTGVQLYRWYQMGITDIEDLQWLLKFYKNEDWPLSIVGGALTHARWFVQQMEELERKGIEEF